LRITGVGMSKLRVHTFCISLDGYGAGPAQGLENPLGEGGLGLHGWMWKTQFGKEMLGDADGVGETGVDNDFMVRGFENIGAWILGRNMFGPIRGPWPDQAWRGWWGENPPYHTDVYVLTHHAREPLTMEGGTTFHFVTDGIEAALERARASAGGKDVRLGGGVAAIKQYLSARLIDELHVAISPVLLGRGESLFSGLDLPRLGYACTQHVPGAAVTHAVFTRSGARAEDLASTQG
jgi:dihydrofolate reductase